MEIVWKSNKVRKDVEKRVASSDICRCRMSELKHAPCFLGIPKSAKPHFLKGDLKGYFAIDFDYPARLICEPVGEYELRDGQYVKETITCIEIVKIEADYH
ncbi:MAG: hypothetical protein ACLFNN_03010 [Candidatus Paceibacterota bacterium]